MNEWMEGLDSTLSPFFPTKWGEEDQGAVVAGSEAGAVEECTDVSVLRPVRPRLVSSSAPPPSLHIAQTGRPTGCRGKSPPQFGQTQRNSTPVVFYPLNGETTGSVSVCSPSLLCPPPLPLLSRCNLILSWRSRPPSTLSRPRSPSGLPRSAAPRRFLHLLLFCY
ncbi:unnamed protein product [Bursaphelenchus xylophilus]|uniref:(pine wood nematode) hypothetical protein n=1 Tax=Bursaphelenchus xylophilus TaxID=6326 RepID=A0A1I7SSA7_BURXY|nr:unnamed protein product [Bursaphelenchus xylophilus]CAG9097808.1 unnamed protein product [Bursaphelenchus xylophilus]